MTGLISCRGRSVILRAAANRIFLFSILFRLLLLAVIRGRLDSFLSLLSEKGSQQTSAFFLQQTTFPFRMVVVLGNFEQAGTCLHGTSLGIIGTEIHFPDSGLDDCSCTHGTGFQSDIQITVFQPPASDVPGSLFYGDHLGMGRRLLQLFSLVESFSYNFVIMDNDTANGNFILFLARRACLMASSMKCFECSDTDMEPPYMVKLHFIRAGKRASYSAVKNKEEECREV